MTTFALYTRVIARFGVSTAAPVLQTAELGYDTDTFTGRYGDNTSSPPMVMTTKSTTSFIFNTPSVSFKNIVIQAGGRVAGIDLSTLNQVPGIVYRSGVSGVYKNVSISSADGTIIANTENTDYTNIIDLRLDASIADSLKFTKLGGAWQTVLDIVTAPPVNAAEGDVYLVDNNGVGLFSGQDNKLAMKVNTGWAFKTLLNRSLARSTLSGLVYEKTSAGWVSFSLSGTHTHTISNVTGLEDALNTKASSTHTHSIADIDGLQTALNNSTLLNKVSKAGDTMTGRLLMPQGTVSTPVIAASVDSNTGIMFPATDTIALVTGGVERFRAGPKGQLGIAGANYGDTGKVLVGNAGGPPSWVDPNTLLDFVALKTAFGIGKKIIQISSLFVSADTELPTITLDTPEPDTSYSGFWFSGVLFTAYPPSHTGGGDSGEFVVYSSETTLAGPLSSKTTTSFVIGPIYQNIYCFYVVYR